MKPLELEPTRNNLLEMYQKDPIERNDELHYFVKMLDSLPCKTVVSIDGGWGSGKTFFVKQAKMIFDAYNDYTKHSKLTTDEETAVKNVFQKFDKDGLKRAATVYYDAWLHDDDEDPVLSLIYCIMQRFGESLENPKTEKVKKLVECAGEIIDNLIQGKIGFEPLKYITQFITGSDKSAVKRLEEKYKLKSKIDEFLTQSLVINLNEPQNSEEKIIIFIDELDRCSPLYAVKLLERIKHYFSHEKVVFVFSCNTSELQHSIKSLYGNDFDAYRYLDRFFNIRLQLSNVDFGDYTSMFSLETNFVNESIAQMAKLYGLQLREICHVYYYVNSITANMNLDNFEQEPRDNIRAFKYYVACFLPIITILYLHDRKKYDSFMSGNGADEYLRIINKLVDLKNSFIHLLLAKDETIESIDANRRLKASYEAMFVIDLEYNNPTVGKIKVGRKVQNDFLQIVHGLSSTTKFE